MFTVEFQPLQAKYIPSSALELERQTYKVETKKKGGKSSHRCVS